MSRPSQTQIVYVQIVPNGKWICPDYRAFKTFRAFFVRSKAICPDHPRWTHESLNFNARWSGHDRTIVWTWTHESLIMNAQKFFVRSCPDFRAFMSRPSCGHQTIVLSCPDHRAFMSRPSCGHQTIVLSCPDHRAFMSRPSCAHLQTIVRSCVFPDRVILNARHTLRAFISVWTYLVSVWDLSLGKEVVV